MRVQACITIKNSITHIALIFFFDMLGIFMPVQGSWVSILRRALLALVWFVIFKKKLPFSFSPYSNLVFFQLRIVFGNVLHLAARNQLVIIQLLYKEEKLKKKLRQVESEKFKQPT